MKYEKPLVEVIQFESGNIFMAASGNGNPYTYSTAYLSACTGVQGQANNFTCDDFAGYTNPQNKDSATVTLSDGSVYTYDYRGHHWQCHRVNN